MDDLQHYPTTARLSQRAWKKFTNRDFKLVLDPSAGDGALLHGHPHHKGHYTRRDMNVHCIEINVAHHPALAVNYAVVGLDFMQFQGGAMYSHIIMNPPFAYGAQHLLKAWSLLWDGEIVCILNAETVRNPHSRDRLEVLRLIEQHGEVEFIKEAFAGADAKRKTDVEIALVYLRKKAAAEDTHVSALLDSLAQDSAGARAADAFEPLHELALPSSEVSNLVRGFDAAVRALREAAFAQSRQMHYANLLGSTLAARRGDTGSSYSECGADWVRKTVNAGYIELKDRAWAAVLHSTAVLSKLSSQGQKIVESKFEQIKKLDFTESNIHGFLLGLCENLGHVQLETACHVFDQITRYHSENTVYYKGWKSNDRHRACGMRIKTTRFVLPGHGGYSHCPGWETERFLADFDKVFSMLDGKREPSLSLLQAFKANWAELRAGARVSSDYFDVRFYKGVGTIHFFARRADLVDRLNRMVGRHRQWLPPEAAKVPDAFWLQYEKAEKFDRELRAKVSELRRNDPDAGARCWGSDPFRVLARDMESDKAAHARAMGVMAAALGAVHEARGVRWDNALNAGEGAQALEDVREDAPAAQLLLCA